MAYTMRMRTQPDFQEAPALLYQAMTVVVHLQNSITRTMFGGCSSRLGLAKTPKSQCAHWPGGHTDHLVRRLSAAATEAAALASSYCCVVDWGSAVHSCGLASR